MSMTGSTLATRNISILMERYGKYEMQPDTAFSNVFFDIGGTTDSDDGNEIANEMFFYSMFRDIPSANNFLDTLATLSEEMQQAMMEKFKEST